MSDKPRSLFRRFTVTMYHLDENYPAYNPGRRWNGWAKPHFTRQTAEELVENFNAKERSAEEGVLSFEDDRDAVICKYPDLPGREPEVFPGHDAETVDGERHLYPVGAGAWVWETVGEEDSAEEVPRE